MKFESYWHATAPAFSCPVPPAPAERADVAVIGAGFTGLGAARKLALEGRKVVVLEAEAVGSGASGRNGGHLNNGIAHGFADATAQFGLEKARAIYKAFDVGIETIERLVEEESIDCDFRRSGKLKLASKAGHYETIARNFDLVHREVDPETEMLSKADLPDEVGSDAFHGAMLSKKSAMMHMGKFVHGLAQAASRHGAEIHENTPVIDYSRTTTGWELSTPAGPFRADKVLLATGAYTPPVFKYFRRRVIAVGSFLIATRPLTETEVMSVMPGNRTCVTSLNIGNYFRLSPDNRLIFGGRARFSGTSDQSSDARSGDILRSNLTHLFPQLAGIDIDYCWGGLVDMTKDRFPRAGEKEGLFYCLGYSGHGAQIATHMGEIMADLMMDRENRNPWDGLAWPAVPGHFGKPWFLPLVGGYFKMKDWMS
jgi:glycine/D-amino acid oxidase-like deaminating enzyme